MPHHRQVRGRHCVTEQNEALLLKMRQCFFCRNSASGEARWWLSDRILHSFDHKKERPLPFDRGLDLTVKQDYSWPASFL